MYLLWIGTYTSACHLQFYHRICWNIIMQVLSTIARLIPKIIDWYTALRCFKDMNVCWASRNLSVRRINTRGINLPLECCCRNFNLVVLICRLWNTLSRCTVCTLWTVTYVTVHTTWHVPSRVKTQWSCRTMMKFKGIFTLVLIVGTVANIAGLLESADASLFSCNTLD